MHQVSEEILEKLNIYERNYTQYTKCLCRGIELLISNKPEEKIRQIFLCFLIYRSGLFPNLINLKVEYNNLDIAIYRNIDSETFRPFQPPAAIIEVKREKENLLNYANQLLRYLNEQRSPIGILFNGNDVIFFKKDDKENGFSRVFLNSIEDISSVILEATHQVNDDYLEFRNARDGDVNSFVYLIKKYGKHTLHKFSFVLKSDYTPIVGCCFSCDQDCIYYDLYGKYSRKKRFCFKYHDFDKLISVIY
jgi:hypothetical protein